MYNTPMKKLSVLLILSIFSLSVFAADFPPLKFSNISLNKKISYNQDLDKWSYGADKLTGNYYTKTKGFGDVPDYINQDKEYVFNTNCDFETIYGGKFLCYSNADLKFYQISLNDNDVIKSPISEEEITELLSGYKIIKISDFAKSTNAYKMKKDMGSQKVFIYNDTDKSFEDYTFTSGNTKFSKYSLNGFVTILSDGMIQFSSENHPTSESPWYVILVR